MRKSVSSKCFLASSRFPAASPLCEMTDSRPRFLTKTPIAAPRPDRVLFCPLSGRAAGAIER